jgi:hypothetical protein
MTAAERSACIQTAWDVLNDSTKSDSEKIAAIISLLSAQN